MDARPAARLHDQSSTAASRRSSGRDGVDACRSPQFAGDQIVGVLPRARRVGGLFVLAPGLLGADDPDAGQADHRRRDLVRADAARQRTARRPLDAGRVRAADARRRSSSGSRFAFAVGARRRRGRGRARSLDTLIGFSFAALIDPTLNTPSTAILGQVYSLFAAGLPDDRRRPAA